MDKIFVTVRDNQGTDSEHEVESMEKALRLAKTHRTTNNHMVCIEVGGCREKRWDRDRIVGGNRWQTTDPDEFETLGPIRAVVRG
ncbi:MAG: hypothetical protein KKB70_07890 [Proteobacteria bacterium]|nr:hypothetical protein [Pseudomonadota bacterium]